MFYPPDSPAGRQSDMERFSSLSRLIPIHDVTVMDGKRCSQPTSIQGMSS